MTKRMLIDATHPEETRVVVADGNRLEEFDYETSTKKQLKGNIYLAKVTRVEPSLQAAFVDYGGNRHGFLAFNEIHPDYYRIPIEDREALIAESSEVEPEESDDPEGSRSDSVETVGGDESDEIERVGEAQRQRLRTLTRQYKIQEVIKRRQILLVQVVKEERGNKGAALTTYLSLAGRYCVLMPNTARGGGISRKITLPAHRKRLKSILTDLDAPEGMAVILRTAGVERSRAEIKRDYEYLRRLWDQIRELTLKSTAPALIYEEGNVIKRSLRDLYAREIEEVLVEGEEAYRAAKDFMKTMIPSHAKRVRRYEVADIPMFHRYQIEAQLDEIHDQVVSLRSGGYIVINPTEALVSIDVNSGRATRERNIEQTALQTNLEASTEVARQLRLRDLAGLIVVDYIDMDETRNNVAVERRLKEAMKSDRARIQVGRISPFGLLELSRQRMRPSLVEASTQPCPMCSGSGTVRSIESAALRVLRAIEEEGIRRRTKELKVSAPTSVSIYVLNQKRHALNSIEARYGFLVSIDGDDHLVPPNFRLERVRSIPPAAEREPEVVRAGEGEVTQLPEAEGERPRRRRRRARRPAEEAELEAEAAAADVGAEAPAAEEPPDEESLQKARRRRGRRGGRRRTRREPAVAAEGAELEGEEAPSAVEPPDAAELEPSPEPAAVEEASKPRTRRRRRAGIEAATTDDAGTAEDIPAEPADADVGAEASEAAQKMPTRRRRRREPRAEPAKAEVPQAPLHAAEAAEPPEPAPARRNGGDGDAADAPVAGQEGRGAGASREADESVSEQRRRRGWWNRLTS
ncbi:MAG: ribonuclease E/G [Alphaproteobacteria bacterium]